MERQGLSRGKRREEEGTDMPEETIVNLAVTVGHNAYRFYADYINLTISINE